MKLMLIDGNSLINRAFYAIRPLTNRDGEHTNAVFGFLNTYLRLVDEEAPDAVCVCFDMRAKTFRHEQYAGYKAQRKPMPDELAQQMPLIKQALDLLGVPRMEAEGFEADDLLGTLARLGREQGARCTIVTGDRDSLQFIAQGALVCLVSTKAGQTVTERYDDALFRAQYRGLSPEKIVDLKALMGDKSDNIPGVPGIGEKGALDLLERFGSLDGVYAQLDDARITASVRKKLTEGRDMAYLSYRLASAALDAPVSAPPSALTLKPRHDGALFALLERLELRQIIKKLGLSPGDMPETPPAFAMPPVEHVETGAALDALTAALDDRPAALAAADSLLACAISHGGRVFTVMAADVGAERFDALLERILTGGHAVLHDGKRLLRHMLERGELPATPLFDTALAAYLLNPTQGDYSIERCARGLLAFEALPRQAYRAEDAFSPLLGERPALTALAQHAALISALHEHMAPRLREDGMERLLLEVELPLTLTLARMEQAGMKIDRQRLSAFGDELQARISALEASIWAHAGERFNIGSTKQLGVILFEKLGLKALKKTKTGYSTDIEALESLRDAHPIIEALIEYRKRTKLKSTYVDGLMQACDSDGVVRSSFQQTVTATGRLSSTDPNLQNIPIRNELGAEIRRCFVPRDGNVLIDADYSQIELRILAHMAGDAIMIDAFQSGEDIHRTTASQVFGVPLADVTAPQRSRAKAVNFGIVYGISAFSLSADIGVTPKQAQQYIESYFEKYTGVRDYMAAIKESARRDGFVTTLLGRRRYLPELKSPNHNIRSFGERAALNTPIQGTAADVIKLAMLRVDERLRAEAPDARLVLQVHDELIIEAPRDRREQVAALLKHEMENAVHYAVTMRADVSWGDNWYDAK